MCKMDKGCCGDLVFLFDEKIFVRLCYGYFDLKYQIDDGSCFLSFNPKSKEFFREWPGFGGDEKHFKPDWWKNPSYDWKEI